LTLIDKKGISSLSTAIDGRQPFHAISDSSLPRAIRLRLKGTTRHHMANTKSAKKAARQAERRTLMNKSRRSRMRTFVRKVEEAIAAGDKGAANEALRLAQPEIMRSATKGVLHKNTASRKISRLSARIRTLAVAA